MSRSAWTRESDLCHFVQACDDGQDPLLDRMQTLRPQDWRGRLFRRTCERREAGRRKRYRSQLTVFAVERHIEKPPFLSPHPILHPSGVPRSRRQRGIDLCGRYRLRWASQKTAQPNLPKQQRLARATFSEDLRAPRSRTTKKVHRSQSTQFVVRTAGHNLRLSTVEPLWVSFSTTSLSLRSSGLRYTDPCLLSPVSPPCSPWLIFFNKNLAID